MKSLMILSLLLGFQARADYVLEQPAPKCYQLTNGSSVMKFEYEYKLGYIVVIVVGNNKPIKKYMTKIFTDGLMNKLVEIDCEAFNWRTE